MDNRVVNLDGKVYSIAGGNGCASTANSYVYDPATLAWTAIAQLPGARNAVAVGRRGRQDHRHRRLGGRRSRRRHLVLRPGGQRLDREWPTTRRRGPPPVRLSSTASCTPSVAAPPRPARRCRTASSATTRRPTAGRRWPTTRSRSRSRPAAGSTAWSTAPAATTARRRRRPSYVYDPGANTWTPIADAPADTLGQLVRRRQRQAARRRRCPGRGDHQRRLRLRPGRRTLGRPAERQHRPVPRWRGVRLLQDRRLVRQLHRDGGQRGAARVRGLRRVGGRRQLDDHRQDRRPPWHRAQSVTVQRDDGPERRPAGHLHGVGRHRREHAVRSRRSRDHDVTPAETWGKLVGTVTGQACTGATAPLAGCDGPGRLLGGSCTFTTDVGRQVRLLAGPPQQPADADRRQGRLLPAGAHRAPVPR